MKEFIVPETGYKFMSYSAKRLVIFIIYIIFNSRCTVKINISLQTVSSTAQCAAGTTVSTSLHSLLPTQQNVSQAPFLDQTNNKSSWSAIMSRSGDGM